MIENGKLKMENSCPKGKPRPFCFLEKDVKNSRLYIGINAGKIISNKIANAKTSIKIVSPYFGKKQIYQLLEKQSQNVDIHVISTDGNRDFRDPAQSGILKEIIKQEKSILKESKSRFDRTKLFAKIYAILYVLSLAILSYLQFKGISPVLFQYKYVIGLLVLVLPLCYKRYKSIRIFEYAYKTAFPVCFVKNPMCNREAKAAGNKFIHSKLYIIDDQIAFIGSINFTYPGFFKSYETCMTIIDKEVIMKLSKYFDELYQIDWAKININDIGKKIYGESVN